MTSIAFRALCVVALLTSGCSSSGLFGGRSSQGRDSIGKAFVSTDDASPAEAKGPRSSKSPATKGPRGRRAAAPATDRRVPELLAAAKRLEQADNSAGARSAYEQVLEREPANTVANYQLAVMADNERRFEDAERHYQTLLVRTPKNPDLLASLGWSYLLQQRYDESEQALRGALAVNPRHRTALYNLGWLYGTLGDYDQALGILRAAGSEDEAQKSMAELFPHGRPRNADVAASVPRNPFAERDAATDRGRAPTHDLRAPALGNGGPSPDSASHGIDSPQSDGRTGVIPAGGYTSTAGSDANQFEQLFAHLEAGGASPSATRANQPRRAEELPLAPPPEAAASALRADATSGQPVITPRRVPVTATEGLAAPPAGNPAAVAHAGGVHAGSAGAAGNSAPHQMAATDSGNEVGKAFPARLAPKRSGLPEWPHRTGDGDAAASAIPREVSPQALAAHVGLLAGPGGLFFAVPPRESAVGSVTTATR